MLAAGDGAPAAMPLAWSVGCRITFDVSSPVTVALQIAPSPDVASVDDQLQVTLDGDPVEVVPATGDHGTVVHLLESGTGELDIAYHARASAAAPVVGAAGAVDDLASHAPDLLDLELLTYLRPSRYCPSDRMGPLVARALGHLEPGPELLAAVGSWVHESLLYELGSSGPTDTAVDTVLAGRGVCRDFAHVAVTALRALDVPARLVAAYAPGLSPMDFHAVAEGYLDGAWHVVDGTRLAPRQSLLRVATGRDAADTAFATVVGGVAELTRSEVTSIVDGDLPLDDHLTPVVLPEP